MRPSSSVTFEPGVERGVPWGRDLFTFVTSAAGHMMRTLQKPKKNRPSKRQVNHRRFLHNMIQRKFAEIDAANHQLASALLSTEQSSICSSPSRHPVTPDQSHRTFKEALLPAADDLTFRSHETEISELKQTDAGEFIVVNPKGPIDQSKTISSTASGYTLGKGTKHQTLKKGGENDEQSEFALLDSLEQTVEFPQQEELFQTRCFGDKGTDRILEENLYSWIEKYNMQPNRHNSSSNIPALDKNVRAVSPNMDSSTVLSPPLSPEFSPLSLDSCDFGIQMITDLAECSQSNHSVIEPEESPQADIVNLLEFEFNDRDFGGGMDTQPPSEDILGCQMDGTSMTGRALIDDITFLEQSGGFVEKLMIQGSSDYGSGVKHLDCETGQCGYGPEYECFGGSESATNSFISGVEPSSQCMLTLQPEATGRGFSCSKSLPCPDIPPAQLSISKDYHCDIPDPDRLRSTCFQQDSSCFLMNGDTQQNYTPFGGIARSFPAPAQNPHQVLTLPLEDDWLFTDIMEDEGSSGGFQCQGM